MRKIILTLIFLQLSVYLIAQEHYVKTIEQEQNYLKLKKFLADQKFNVSSFQQLLSEWIILSRKKEYALVQVNASHVIQTMPLNYDAKGLMWISPSKRYSYRDDEEYINGSFGSRVRQDIIHDIGSAAVRNISKRKYHYRYSAAGNNKPYQTPSFLQF